MGKGVKPEKKDKKEKKPKGKEDNSGKVYRQFSREKYNKYKRQFPRMRESEIVSKIIKEWEALGEEAKKDIQKKYTERSGKDAFKSGSSSLSKGKSKSKSKSKDKDKPQKRKTGSGNTVASRKSRSMAKSAIEGEKMEAEKPKKKKKPSPQIRVFEDKKKKSPKRDTSDFKRSSSKSAKPYDSSEDPEDLIAKMKGIKKGKDDKTKNTAYLQFFKYYYERLSAEHPRWNSTQITTIIRLLWKKRAKQTKKGELRRAGKRIEKAISGWQFYRKTKEAEGHTRPVIKEMWRGLPIESKRYYKIQGQGKRLRKKTSGLPMRKILSGGVTARVEESKADGILQKDYSWMEHQMH